jgi:hypothetical protein
MHKALCSNSNITKKKLCVSTVSPFYSDSVHAVNKFLKGQFQKSFKLCIDVEKLIVLCYCQLCQNYDLLSVSLPFILWKSGSPKANGAQKGKVKADMLNLSHETKTWDLLQGVMSLAEVGQHNGKNESSISSMALLGTIYPWTQRAYCT